MSLRYTISGRQDTEAETVVLSAGLGGMGAFWQPQLAALGAHFRVVLYDHRGTGQNREPLLPDYSISMMADDVVGILDDLGAASCRFAGHALGGLVGLDLALRHPGRVSKLVLVNAWAKVDSHTQRCFAMRLALLDNTGIEAYVRAQPIFLYPAAWLSAHAERIAQDDEHGIAHFQGAETLKRRIAALLAFDLSADLHRITVPSLVAASRDDVLVPWTASAALAGHLPQAELWTVPEGGHGFTVTEPDTFNAKAIAFLASKG